MSKLAQQTRASEPSTEKADTVAEACGRAALRPEINTLLVIDAFKDSYLGQDIDLGLVMGHLEKSIEDVKSGDLAHIESMLLGQATTLQALFSCFAKKAANQQQLHNYQTFMTMAFKAQAQSRATLQTLVELKNPRQATFVKQSNIAHGPQQVNNGHTEPSMASRAENPATVKNKLMEIADEKAKDDGLDARAPCKAGRTDTPVEAVGQVNRAKKCRG